MLKGFKDAKPNKAYGLSLIITSKGYRGIGERKFDPVSGHLYSIVNFWLDEDCDWYDDKGEVVMYMELPTRQEVKEALGNDRTGT
jgi:hypothetical protein